MKERTDEQIKTVPLVKAKFTLKSFSIALVNNQQQSEGLEIFSKDFKIKFKKFDDDSEDTVHSFSVVAKNKEFGINQLMLIEN